MGPGPVKAACPTAPLPLMHRRGSVHEMVSSFLVEKDSRGRVSLGQVLTEQRYLVTVDSGGRVILEPAVVMTRTEARLLADPAFRTAMTIAASEPTEPLDLDAI